jgi:transcription elongation GreA/GreB family factor
MESSLRIFNICQITFPKNNSLLDYKDQLLKHCRDYVLGKEQEIGDAIHVLQDSANEETKSSAGDKYETGRAMMQIEIGNLTAQLSEIKKLKQAIGQIKTDQTAVVQLGSLTLTSAGNYYIAISAGQINIEGSDYITVSAGSPIALKLIGKKSGEVIELNKKQIEILQVM